MPSEADNPVARREQPDGKRDSGNSRESSDIADPAHGARFCLERIPSSQKNGGQTPVINLKRLNEYMYIHTEHFKMEGIHVLQDLLKQETAW